MPSPRTAMKHVVTLGMLTMQVVSDYERDGNLTQDKVKMILDAISKIYTMVGVELGLEDEVASIFKELKDDIASFNALPEEVKQMLINHGEGIGNA